MATTREIIRIRAIDGRWYLGTKVPTDGTQCFAQKNCIYVFQIVTLDGSTTATGTSVSILLAYTRDYSYTYTNNTRVGFVSLFLIAFLSCKRYPIYPLFPIIPFIVHQNTANCRSIYISILS